MQMRILLPHVTIAIAIVLLISLFNPLHAQEVNCAVRVNYESVPAGNKDLLATFESDVKDYVNNYKWGTEVLEEKIECTLARVPCCASLMTRGTSCTSKAGQ